MALRSVEEGKIDSQKEIPTGSERILVLDDEKLVVIMEKVILEGLGYTVYTETDSLKALETIHSDPAFFDLVITDHLMPKLSGVRFSKQIYQSNPDLPVILCSGDISLVENDDYFQAGNRVLLRKPLDAVILATAIRALLDEEGVVQQLNWFHKGEEA